MEVDFGKKTATVTMGQGRALTQAVCDKAFENTSYRVASFETVPAAAGGGPPPAQRSPGS